MLTTSIHPNWVRTPLIAPVEDELKKRGASITEPTVVADSIVKSITIVGQRYPEQAMGDLEA